MRFSFSSPMKYTWFSMVEQRKILSDRGRLRAFVLSTLIDLLQVWSALLPKLLPCLNENREARLRDERLKSRHDRLTTLLAIQFNSLPVVRLAVNPPMNRPWNFMGTSSPVIASHSGVFPKPVDALQWPVVRELLDTDIDADSMANRFEERRPQIDKHIADWKADVEGHMAALLYQGRNHVIEHISLAHQLGNPLVNLSKHQMILLRADSFFQFKNSAVGRPLLYDAAIAAWYTRSALSTTPSKPLDLNAFRQYDEAQSAAQVLLASLGRLNACYLELGTLGRRYVCARCHDSSPKTWEDIASTLNNT